MSLNRRTLLAAAALLAPGAALARTRTITVYKTPTCGCCDGWVEHLRGAGFETTVEILDDLSPIRRRHGLPDRLMSCHSGVADGYIFEGHVPAADVIRLLDESPRAVGLAVPGMPLGSPGMEVPGRPGQTYETLLVLNGGAARVYARHNQG